MRALQHHRKVAAMPASLGSSLFRIDKFHVPPRAMPAFMDRVRRTHALLGAQPGCRQNLVLTQTGGPGEFNVVTMVEWDSAEAHAQAREAVQARYAQEGFDAAAFMRSLGIRPDVAVYSPAPIQAR